MSSLDDSPDLRSIPELLSLMERTAERCESATDAIALFDEAFRLAVELRVPRMPDTDEELVRMLEAAREGPTFTTDEVLEHLKRSQDRSVRLRIRQREHLAAGRTADAARMLVPGDDCMLSWIADVAVTTAAHAGRFDAYAISTHGTASCTSPDEGLATLGAVMRMHRYRNLWMR